MSSRPHAPEPLHPVERRGVDALRAAEPRRSRDPFSDARVRARLLAIAAERADGGAAARLRRWIVGVPRAATAGALLSAALLLAAAGLPVGIDADAALRAGTSAPAANSAESVAPVPASGSAETPVDLPVSAVGADEAVGRAPLLLAGLIGLGASIGAALVAVRRRRA
ncbi:MAG: hypothetical protein RLZZ432_471 [Chloroflexota bacterium]|jgi:hypothetical protein